MERRRFLALGTATVATLAGCSTGRGSGEDGSPRPPAQVTTSSAEGIELLVSQIAVGPDSTGPDAYYRLRNTADADATIRVETRLSIEGGETYSAFATVTVPAGDEVTVRYRIVEFDALSDTERTQVRQGDGVSFETLVNGQLRDDV